MKGTRASGAVPSVLSFGSRRNVRMWLRVTIVPRHRPQLEGCTCLLTHYSPNTPLQSAQTCQLHLRLPLRPLQCLEWLEGRRRLHLHRRQETYRIDRLQRKSKAEYVSAQAADHHNSMEIQQQYTRLTSTLTGSSTRRHRERRTAQESNSDQ